MKLREGARACVRVCVSLSAAHGHACSPWGRTASPAFFHSTFSHTACFYIRLKRFLLLPCSRTGFVLLWVWEKSWLLDSAFTQHLLHVSRSVSEAPRSQRRLPFPPPHDSSPKSAFRRLPACPRFWKGHGIVLIPGSISDEIDFIIVSLALRTQSLKAT